MASTFPIILLLVSVLASQCECAPSDSSVLTTDLSKVCNAEMQTAMGLVLSFDFSRVGELPGVGNNWLRCWVEYGYKRVLQWLDAMELRVTQLISNNKQ